jgi:HEAT repeat protein
MKIPCTYVVVVAASMLLAARADAQTPPRDKTGAARAGATEASAIAAGWSALAAGRYDDAIRTADALLAKTPSHHGALELKVEALSATQPLVALDAYEQWLGRTRIEDVFILTPIARGTLEQIAAGTDQALQRLAFRRLADSGDARAAVRLQEMLKGSGVTDLQRAMDGDPAAAARLVEPKAAMGLPPQALAKVLPAAGPAAVPMLRSLLKHPAAPVRMEAALSLGKLNAVDAIPDLKAMMADPELRSYVAVALARLGDADGETVVQELLQSPVYDMRLLGAQAYEGKGPGPWVQALMPALQDPNGLTRVRAAEMLAPVAPEAARPVLVEAARDSNPVVRADVMRVLERTELFSPADQPIDPSSNAKSSDSQGLATLRRLLRDPDAITRLSAAGSILALVRGR